MALTPGTRKPGDVLRGPAKTLQYEPRYREAVVAFMGKGYSLTAFAGEIGTTRANLMKWCAKHPPFAEAVERAQARRARLLEDKMLDAKGAGAFGAHMQALKTAAPDEWTTANKPRRAAGGHVEVQVDLPDNSRE